MKVQNEIWRAQCGASVVRLIALIAAVPPLSLAACLLVACGGGSAAVDASVPSDTGMDASPDDASLDATIAIDGDVVDADPNALSFWIWTSNGFWHAPGPLNIEARVSGGVPPYSYSWTPADRFPNSYEIFRSENVLGVYETCVEVSDSIGASVSGCVMNEVFATPVASLGDLPTNICVQDSPILVTFQDNLVEGTAPHRRTLGRARAAGNNPPLLVDPVSPVAWEVGAADIGEWVISYRATEAFGEYGIAYETINIVDCP